jgi:ferredoxin
MPDLSAKERLIKEEQIVNIQKVYAVYFSPTGTTKSVTKSMLTEFDTKREEIDLTPYESRNNSYSFNEDELVIIGIPVYGGRVPITAEKRIKLLQGNNTPAVLVATYGNMHYSNTLHELQQIVNLNGFITIAAAAVIAEHNVVNTIASGRPNTQDLAAISTFANQVYTKASQSDGIENMVVKGKIPAFPRNKYPVLPYGDKKCTKCGTCIKLCPVRAIDDPQKKAGKECIRCTRCIKYCPQNARTFMKLMKVGVRLLLSFISFVSRNKKKQPEFFL